jgi:UDPglucose--hexose-1-phosphate uridylyltransferase
MGAVMPRESETAARFEQLRQTQGVRAATDYFYGLCIASNYIRTAQIAKNIKWDYPCKYGRLEITINLTKPEKDPKTIALERLQPAASYPKCMLCIENIGYAGRVNFPARQNHRVVPLTLCGETWYLQYSPYVYYNEHCIVFAHEHAPMAITPRTFEQLFDFVTQFPHYTCGSNADLPIVGGSILSHMHFQGGSYAFPMQSAETLCRYRVPEYPDISVETIRWPVSTVRACGRDAAQLIGFAGRLLETWRGYSDAEADILAETMENGSPTPHNTVTPILHYDEKKGYVLDLVPRNNRTTEQYPEGIFHPHREIHHIKKENIGLIEVMGLAILPSRLAQQSEAIAAVLCGQTDAKACRAAAPEHADWLDLLVKKYGTALSPEQAQDAVKREIGAKFETCLEHAGVFKLTPDGLAAFDRFLAALGCEKL